MKLVEEVQKLRQSQEATEKENERVSTELVRSETQRKKLEHDLQALRESRGKILRGLNTQTEIALVQLKKDFECMRKQLLAKDEIISVQERKIASLIEANSTLRSGLQDLLSLPKSEDYEEEDEGGGRREGGERNVHTPRGSSGTLENGGHHHSLAMSPTSPSHNSDLYRIISQLGSGRFDQSV